MMSSGTAEFCAANGFEKFDLRNLNTDTEVLQVAPCDDCHPGERFARLLSSPFPKQLEDVMGQDG